MTKADFYIKENNTRPALEVQLLSNDRSSVSLEGARVRFKMQQSTSQSLLFNKQARVIDKQTGTVVYDWDREDTAEPGQYRAEFVVDFDYTDSFEPDETFPNKDYLSIIVEEQL